MIDRGQTMLQSLNTNGSYDCHVGLTTVSQLYYRVNQHVANTDSMGDFTRLCTLRKHNGNSANITRSVVAYDFSLLSTRSHVKVDVGDELKPFDSLHEIFQWAKINDINKMQKIVL